MSTPSAEHHPQATRRSFLPGPYRALQDNPALALLFSGQVISALGEWLYVATLAVLIFTITGSALAAAALSCVRLVPYMLFLPLSGVLADRFDRKALMITADLGRGVCMLGLLAVASPGRIWLAYPLVFIATSLGSLFRPALNATIPSVVQEKEQLVLVNALVSQIDALAIVVGPALAGLLLLFGDPRAAFALNGASYLVSVATLMRLRLPGTAPAAPEAREHWLEDVAGGVRFLFTAHDGALGAVTVSTAAMCGFIGAGWTLFVALALQTWDFGTDGIGFLMACFGLGGLFGGLLAGRLVRRFALRRTYAGGLVLGGAAILALAVSPAGCLPFILLAIFGCTDVINQVAGTTLVQHATPERLLGRVFGAFEAVAVSATVLGALAAGPLLAAGPRAATLILALATTAVVSVTLPRLRAIETGGAETAAAAMQPGDQEAIEAAAA